MTNRLKKLIKAISLPVFSYAFYVYSYNLAQPVYNTGLAGFGVFGNFIVGIGQFFYGMAVAQFYLQLFKFDDGKKMNWLFTAFFLATLVPVISFYTVFPHISGIVSGKAVEEMYFNDSAGVLFSLCLTSVLLFFGRLDLKRYVGPQILVAFLSVIPPVYYLMDLYDAYYANKYIDFIKTPSWQISNAVKHFACDIYDLMPEFFKIAIEKHRSGLFTRYENDQAVILLASLLLVPVIILILHKILYRFLCSAQKTERTKRNENWKKLRDAIAWYTIIMPPIIYVCRCINGYLTVVVLWMSPVVFIVMHRKLLAAIVFRKRNKKPSVSPSPSQGDTTTGSHGPNPPESTCKTPCHL